MIVSAPAKINLTLDVLGRRSDGRHDISTVMQTLRWSDVLDIELTDERGRVDLTLDDRTGFGVPADATNLAHRAASAILAATGSPCGARIRLVKNVFVQAGLGGGSSDAAATLRTVNHLLGDPLTDSELAKIGMRIGADVPFFLTGGTCLIEGAGERVTPIPGFGQQQVVIVRPAEGVSTADAYAALDRRRESAGSAPAQAPIWDSVSLRNDFEEVIEELCPAVGAARAALSALGCTDILLCGSGSAVFGFAGVAATQEMPPDLDFGSGALLELARTGMRLAATSTSTREENAWL